MRKRDAGIDTLLDLDKSILDQGNGYWVKISARRVEESEHIPHGIRYSLTLHDRHGTRILGFDNAHSVKPPGKFKYAGQVLTHDHKHQDATDKGTPYAFSSADQLLADFFSAVDRALIEVSKP